MKTMAITQAEFLTVPLRRGRGKMFGDWWIPPTALVYSKSGRNGSFPKLECHDSFGQVHWLEHGNSHRSEKRRHHHGRSYGPLIRGHALAIVCAAAAISAQAQTFTKLASFNGQNGENPLYMSPIQATDGRFYGTTQNGGGSANCSNGCGTVFSFDSKGNVNVVHAFDSTDGAYPYAGVIQALDGNLYGTTEAGGANGLGTIFKISPRGTFTTLYTFSGPDGANPWAALIEGTDGNLYGTTFGGGSSSYGTVFRITPLGALTTLFNFDYNDGGGPVGAVVEGADGNFYGTTSYGGAYSYGCVFKVTPAGAETVLYSFYGNAGEFPYAPLIQALNGLFYGTASGGEFDHGGNVFSITSGGVLTSLHHFSGSGDGGNPTGPVLQATDGNFYGLTPWNSREIGNCSQLGCGTIFEITAQGALTTLHNFSVDEGFRPQGGLVQGTDGNFYSATSRGGASMNLGSVFSLSVGLAPFVKLRPPAGTAGTSVQILGTKLSGASSVTFNGTAATFQVISGSLIAAVVPVGATSGTVEVVIPAGTLSSDVAFRVLR